MDMEKLKKAAIYIHGKGGNAQEAEHYRPLFPDRCVIGLDYSAQTPWEAKAELPRLFDECGAFDDVILIGNSIGAYFAMTALAGKKLKRAFFISPIVDMERLILDRMRWADVTEKELREKGEVPTAVGEPLSWSYLCYVRENSIEWSVPTHILYGENDELTSLDTASRFASQTNSTLTVMKNGEHWFHTEEEMAFLDEWISSILRT